MATPTFKKIGFIPGIVTKQWEGREECISVLGREVVIRKATVEEVGDQYPKELEYSNNLFDSIIKDYNFQEYIDSILNREIEPSEQCSIYSRNLKKLKHDIKDSEVRITIKIECIKKDY